ncbi:uncharacterized protein ACBT44_002083 [Syngnathus typhle]
MEVIKLSLRPTVIPISMTVILSNGNLSMSDRRIVRHLKARRGDQCTGKNKGDVPTKTSVERKNTSPQREERISRTAALISEDLLDTHVGLLTGDGWPNISAVPDSRHKLQMHTVTQGPFTLLAQVPAWPSGA